MHAANAYFELIRASIPRYIVCVNVYGVMLPRLKHLPANPIEVMASMHTDALVAEVALHEARTMTRMMWGAAFYRDPVATGGGWALADDFNNEGSR